MLRDAISLRVKKKENLQALVLALNAPQDKIITFSDGADNLNETQLMPWPPMCLATLPTTLSWIGWFRRRSPRPAWECLRRPITVAALMFIRLLLRLGPRLHPRRLRLGWLRRASLSGRKVGYNDLARVLVYPVNNPTSTSPTVFKITPSSKSPSAGSPVRENAIAPQ